MVMSDDENSSKTIISVREIVDSGPLTPGILAISIVCFLLNLLDGYDIVSMSVSASLIQTEWQLSGVEKGYILTSAILGMAMGASLLAPFCDKFGRRPMVLGSVISTSICLSATGFVEESLIQMISIRFLTGLGIGVIMASTTAIALEYAPERWKNFIVPIVVSGYPLGALCVGPISQIVIPEYGWEMMYFVGGVFSFLFVPIVYFCLPETLSFMANQTDGSGRWLDKVNKSLLFIQRDNIDKLPYSEEAPKANSIKGIFEKWNYKKTIMLVLSFFSAYLTIYFLLTWIPSLYINSGYTRSEGVEALTLMNLGGVIGIFAIAIITSRLHLTISIGSIFLIAAALLLSFAIIRPDNLLSLNIMIVAVGVTLYGAFTGMYTVVSRAYGVAERATGIGFSLGVGRLGAVVSPLLAGYLVDAGWTMYPLFVVFAVPILVVSAFMFIFK